MKGIMSALAASAVGLLTYVGGNLLGVVWNGGADEYGSPAGSMFSGLQGAAGALLFYVAIAQWSGRWWTVRQGAVVALAFTILGALIPSLYLAAGNAVDWQFISMALHPIPWGVATVAFFMDRRRQESLS